ncbi:MAG: GNAT family N-acetyltransferase [Acidimicrobiales bacterium]
MTITVRKATTGDAQELGAVLGRAFLDDPVMGWLLPAAGARTTRLPRLFAMELRCLYLRFGEVYTTKDLAGGAVWAPPEAWHTAFRSVLRATPRLVWTLRGRLGSAVRSVAAIEAVHPVESHWYLAVLGTEPARQGEGIGSALLAPVLARCDRDWVPAYLESSKESNVPFYRRLGFEVTGTIDLPSGGPRVWTMWRDPKP